MLISADHEISVAHKYKNIKNFSSFGGSDKLQMLFFVLIDVKMPKTVGILTFMSMKNFMLSFVKHEFFMPPTSVKLRGYIGLGLSVGWSVHLSISPSIRLSVTLWQLRNSRTAYARILKLYKWHVHEK